MSPEPVTRFRPRYRALTPDEIALHDQVKTVATVLDGHFDAIVDRIKEDAQAELSQPTGATALQAVEARRNERLRCVALARTKLEEAIMWAVKGLTG